jgi:hypothetical protein
MVLTWAQSAHSPQTQTASRHFRHDLTYTQSLHHYGVAQTDISVGENILALARLV